MREEVRSLRQNTPVIHSKSMKVAMTASPLVEETQRVDLHPLTSTELAARLDVNPSTISRNKDEGNPHFRAWSAERDPARVSWEYQEGAPRSAKFHPLI